MFHRCVYLSACTYLKLPTKTVITEFINISQASEERIGSICSFISIAFHLANIRRTDSVVEMAIKSVLPWTMAQHFNARLYAQVNQFGSSLFYSILTAVCSHRQLWPSW